MGTKISAFTEETAPNATDMMVVVNGGVTQKVQVQNAVEAAAAQWARVYHNADQSITDATLTALAFNSERADTDVIHDTVTDNSRLICKTAGVHHATATVSFAANATGFRLVHLRVNGTLYVATQSTLSLGAGSPTVLSVATSYALAVNDYFEVVVYQTSGGALNVLAVGNYSPEFSMVRLGA